MELTPYLVFNGDCATAFKFYEKALGGKIIMMQTHGESPMKDQTPADWQNRILHARLTVGDQVLMGSDSPPQDYHKPEGFSVSLSVKKAEEAERVFKALSESGSVQMPLEKTFWAERFGMLTDRFGVPWMVNCDLPA